MKTLMPLKTLALSLAVATLAGCGQGNLLSALSSIGADATAQLAAGQRPGGKGGKQGGQFGGEKGGQLALFATLSLTDEQKAQLQAIAEKYKPEAPEAGTKPEHPGAAIQALLTAETVDVEALKAALAAQPAAPADKADNRLAQLVETRAVLTAAQIAQLVEQLEAEPTVKRPGPDDGNRPAPPDRSAELAAKLKLTAEQQVAFDAYQAKLAANRPAAPEADHHAAERAAMVTFWETGDTAALEAAKPARVAPVVPVDEIVALAGVLTLEQRQQVFGHAFGGPGKGGHGGHGGPQGGKGGHGHEGGKGGFGGQRGPGGEAPVPAPEAEF